MGKNVTASEVFSIDYIDCTVFIERGSYSRRAATLEVARDPTAFRLIYHELEYTTTASSYTAQTTSA
jgi:hypothetical protein